MNFVAVRSQRICLRGWTFGGAVDGVAAGWIGTEGRKYRLSDHLLVKVGRGLPVGITGPFLRFDSGNPLCIRAIAGSRVIIFPQRPVVTGTCRYPIGALSGIF